MSKNKDSQNKTKTLGVYGILAVVSVTFSFTVCIFRYISKAEIAALAF